MTYDPFAHNAPDYPPRKGFTRDDISGANPTKDETPLRVAVVGCGFQGRLHLECLHNVNVEIVAVCDVDLDRAKTQAQAWSAKPYKDYQELLERESLDLLTICTMPDTHRDIAVSAFQSGCHVLCEKPFALTADDAHEMVVAAHRAKRLLTVGFNMRYTAAAQSVAEFVRSPEFGHPVCARGWMLSETIPWWGRHYIKRVSGGGALAATAVHILDLVMWLVGDKQPTTVTASMAKLFPSKRWSSAPSAESMSLYDTEDMFFGHVRFSDGFWLSVEGSWLWDSPGSGWDYSFDLVGTRGQARLSPLRLTTETDEGVLVEVTGGRPSEFDFRASTQAEIADFVNAVREERYPLVRAEEALLVQSVVDALYRSAALGREVEVEVGALSLRPEYRHDTQ
jgi:predicted dehydrogenase